MSVGLSLGYINCHVFVHVCGNELRLDFDLGLIPCSLRTHDLLLLHLRQLNRVLKWIREIYRSQLEELTNDVHDGPEFLV